jgi:hypothetical protein
MNTFVQVKFYFSNEVGNKQCEISVSPFSPLINYKRQLENSSKIDLYGKKLLFKYADQLHGTSFNVEYLQEIVERTRQELKSYIDL